MTDTDRTRRLRTAARVLLGLAMATAGVGHLTFQRRAFRAQVPAWVPFDEDATVLASGVVEIGFGAALLLLPRQRRVVGTLLAVFFGAVFPGNLSQLRNHRDAFGLDSDAKRGVRLLFQPLLVLWALFAGGVVGGG